MSNSKEFDVRGDHIGYFQIGKPSILSQYWNSCRAFLSKKNKKSSYRQFRLLKREIRAIVKSLMLRVALWFLLKNRTFSHLCFFGEINQKNHSFKNLDIKNVFLNRKLKLQVQKVDIFLRGFSMVFVQKSKLLSCVFFGEINSNKNRFLIFQNEKNIFRPENWFFQKWQKLDSFLRG